MERTRNPNTLPSERELAASVAPRLRQLLPAGWGVEPAPGPPEADGSVRITAPDGRQVLVIVEAKTRLNARDVPYALERARAVAGPQPVIFAAAYVSPRAREALIDAGASYLDATGNVRVSLSEPGLAVVAPGASRDPYRHPERRKQSLEGVPAARVVRALVDRQPPWTMRQLAQEAGTSLGSTARTVDFLDREAFVRRDDRGSIQDVDWAALLRRWAEDYDIRAGRKVVTALAPRGLRAVEDRLRKSDISYALSGSLAASRWAPYAEPRLGLVYTPDADRALGEIGARETATGANLVLLEPQNDALPFERRRTEDGLAVVAPSQAVVDLLSGPGRNPEEAMALLDWMRTNERTWRG